MLSEAKHLKFLLRIDSSPSLRSGSE